MRLNKNSQYALILAMALANGTVVNLQSVAATQGLSLHFLEQIGRKLRKSGIIRSIRGPGGGYVLVDNPTIGQVLGAVNTKSFLTTSEIDQYERGTPSQATLALVADQMAMYVEQVLRRTIRSYIQEVQDNVNDVEAGLPVNGVRADGSFAVV